MFGYVRFGKVRLLCVVKGHCARPASTKGHHVNNCHRDDGNLSVF